MTANNQLAPVLSDKQRALAAKHGTPAEFALACYACVPGDISMAEARAAIDKYQVEWDEAADTGDSDA